MGTLLDIGLRSGMAFGSGLFTRANQSIVASAAGAAALGYRTRGVASVGQQAALAVTTASTTMFDALPSLPVVIAAGDTIEIEVIFTLLNDSAATRVYTPLVKIGATTIHGNALSSIANNAAARPSRLYVRIGCTGTATQRTFVDLDIGPTGTGATGYAFGNRSISTATEDMTTVKTFDFQLASAVATATQTARIDQASIRHTPLSAS